MNKILYLLLATFFFSCSVPEQEKEFFLEGKALGFRLGVVRSVSLAYPVPVSRVKGIFSLSSDPKENIGLHNFVSFVTDDGAPVTAVSKGKIIFLETMYGQHKRYFMVIEHQFGVLSFYRGVKLPNVRESQQVASGKVIAFCDGTFDFAIAKKELPNFGNPLASYQARIMKRSGLRFLRVRQLLTGKGQ